MSDQAHTSEHTATATGTGQPSASPPLTRRTDDRILAGVASGLADYLRVEPIVIRLALILLTLFAGGLGILLYVVGWVAIPLRGERSSAAERALAPGAAEGRGRRILGLVLLTIGIVVVTGVGFQGGPPFMWWGDGPFGLLRPGVVWAALLIGVGLLLYRLGDRRLEAGPAPAPLGPQVPPAPAASTPAAPTGATPPYAGEPSAPAVPPAQQSTAETQPPASAAPGGASTPPGPYTAEAGSPPPKRSSSPLGRFTLAAALVAVGVGALLDQTGVADISFADLTAVALVVVAAGLLVGAFLGRARWLIAVALALLPVLAVASVAESAPPILGGPIVNDARGAGDRSYAPTDLDDVRPSYSIGTGRLALDLREVEVPEGETAEVRVTVTAGEIDVSLPEDASASLEGRATVGEVDLVERRAAGFLVDVTEGVQGSEDAGSIHLELEVTAGSITVDRPALDPDGEASSGARPGQSPTTAGPGGALAPQPLPDARTRHATEVR